MSLYKEKDDQKERRGLKGINGSERYYIKPRLEVRPDVNRDKQRQSHRGHKRGPLAALSPYSMCLQAEAQESNGLASLAAALPSSKRAAGGRFAGVTPQL